MGRREPDSQWGWRMGRSTWRFGSALFGTIFSLIIPACGSDRAVPLGGDADVLILADGGTDAGGPSDAQAVPDAGLVADVAWDIGVDTGPDEGTFADVSAPDSDAGAADAAPDGGAGVGTDTGLDAGPRDSGRPQMTIDDYPKVDGSTSTLPLARVIACELLGLSFKWVAGIGDEGAAEILAVPKTPEQQALADAVNAKVVHNKTHQAYLNLVDAKVDMILVANPPSEDELIYAGAAGVSLVWQPVALDALVMLLNTLNTLGGLSRDQIRGIFMGELTDWIGVGGTAGAIHPYVRPINSGSQQLFNAIVMEGLTMPDWPPDRTPTSMGALIDAIVNDPYSIGYSVYYYVTYQRPPNGAKAIAVNGVAPSAESIRDGTYLFAAPVLLVVSDDLAPGSLAFQMREWLLTPDGQEVVGKSGYVPALR